MAGYNYAAGKSNNAVAAEGRGLMTATELAARLRTKGIKGASAKMVDRLCSPEEWHHSSSHYNRVDYYDPDDAYEFLTSEDGEKDLARFRGEQREEAAAKRKFRECYGTVKWTEWSGSGRRKSRDDYEFTGPFQIKGAMITFDGKRKRVDGNWIEVIEHNPGGHREDLSSADLSGANLADAKLAHADLIGADLSSADLSGANLAGADLTGANLTDVNMEGADLTGANLTDANVEGADLTRADMFNSCVMGVNMSRARIWQTRTCSGLFSSRDPETEVS